MFRDGKVMEITKDIDEYLETSTPYFSLFFPNDMNAQNLEWYFLNYFIHVGIMENYEKSMDILSEKLNKPKVKTSFENKSSRFASPSSSSVKIFMEKCEFEYAFFRRALKEND